jgi:alpha-D-ribose 1-methylphosphonate 5-triphosphate synthase subunit PhnL
MTQSAVLRVERYAKQFILHEQNKVIPSSYDVNLEVCSGSLTALTGPTGAGKSTVLKGIYRTYLPTHGRILYKTQAGDVVDLVQADEHRILELRRHEIGFVTQFLHFLPRQSTEDVVAQPLVHRGWPLERARDAAQEILAAMNLPERLWCISPATFSGGEKQRVNLARGFVAKPRLLLLDEPTASLDPQTEECVVDLIEQLKREGVALLAIFHDPGLVKRIADQVVKLKLPSVTESPLEKIA